MLLDAKIVKEAAISGDKANFIDSIRIPNDAVLTHSLTYLLTHLTTYSLTQMLSNWMKSTNAFYWWSAGSGRATTHSLT